MMNTVAPFWDGNETWLVLGGGGLLAAFPLAYAVILPALYLPLIMMLLGLIFRGVAFEFRFKAQPTPRLWDWPSPTARSLATLTQGLVLGGFIQGFEVAGPEFAGGTFDWLTPFSIFTGSRSSRAMRSWADLADHEERRRPPATGPTGWRGRCCWRAPASWASASGRRCASRDCRALVQPAEPVICRRCRW